MQSRGLFNFFTKAADVQQTAAGTRIARGQAAKAIQQQTSAVANKNYAAEQKRRAGTPAQGQQQPTPQVTQSAQQSTYNRQPSSAQVRATVRTADQFGRPTTLVKRRKGERVQSPVFKGGYAVNVDPGFIDWSERGDGSINVRGTRLTQEQYDMYNNIRSQLAGSIAMQGGVDPQTARDQASMMAAQYIGDQVNIANGGKAFNSWQHAEEQQQAPQATQPESPVTPPVQQATQQPETPVTPQPESPVTPPEQPIQQPGTQEQAAKPVTWDLEAGRKDPMGYTKHHTQALNADTIRGWNVEGWNTEDGQLTAKGYYEGTAGRHYNNMQNLYALATNAGLSDKERHEIMIALNREARRYSYYKHKNELYRNSTAAYDAKLHGPDSPAVLAIENRLAEGPVTFGWGHTNLDQGLKDYLDNYFSNNYYVKSIQ